MIKRTWYVIDVKERILGRVSSVIVKYLIGKHKPEYAPYIDIGDYVIVINSKYISISGKKRENKIYYRHSGYIGGIKQSNFKNMLTRNPNRVIEMSVKGMLPKNSLGRVMFNRLKVYSSISHKHLAQSPKVLHINY